MKYTILTLACLLLSSMALAKNGHRHKKPNNGQKQREGYLDDKGKPCPDPRRPCARKPCFWNRRCVQSWEERPCCMCPNVPGLTAVTVNSTVLMVPTNTPTGKCISTAVTTVVPTAICTTFVIPGAPNANCKGERNNMVEELISKYASSDAAVFLNGQQIEYMTSGGGVVSTGVVTVTGLEANAAPGEQSLMGTLAAIMLMAGAALFV